MAVGSHEGRRRAWAQNSRGRRQEGRRRDPQNQPQTTVKGEVLRRDGALCESVVGRVVVPTPEMQHEVAARDTFEACRPAPSSSGDSGARPDDESSGRRSQSTEQPRTPPAQPTNQGQPHDNDRHAPRRTQQHQNSDDQAKRLHGRDMPQINDLVTSRCDCINRTAGRCGVASG